MKILLLNGVRDVCNLGPSTLEKIKQLQAESGIAPNREVVQKMKELEGNIEINENNLAALNTAWEAFIPDNKVKHMGRYGYEYCTKEPLIRAYIMDGFAFVCELAEDMLQKIEDLQATDRTPLEASTMMKINELAAISDKYKANGAAIESVWSKFVSQGDILMQEYQSTEDYCDNIYQVKDWTIRGLSGTCEDGNQYLNQIEDFQRTFEFNFTKDLECRVQKLRIKVWSCRHDALLKLARIEAPDSPEARLEELMEEYGVGEKPEGCQ